MLELDHVVIAAADLEAAVVVLEGQRIRPLGRSA